MPHVFLPSPSTIVGYTGARQAIGERSGSDQGNAMNRLDLACDRPFPEALDASFHIQKLRSKSCKHRSGRIVCGLALES